MLPFKFLFLMLIEKNILQDFLKQKNLQNF
jgi:hypothetical protein